MPARAETAMRAIPTNSGRAGISSSTTWSMTGTVASARFADRPVDGIMDAEDLRQASDLQDLEDPALGAHQPEIPIVAPDPLEAAHQHAETRRVEEFDTFEVDDDPALTRVDQLDELFPQLGRRVDVDLPLDGKHGETVALHDV